MKFYKGNSGTDSKVCSFTLDQSVSFHNRWGKDKMGDRSCENDDIRSMKMCYARKGFSITVFDDGSLGTSDDYAIVFAKTNMKDCVTIDGFETSKTFSNEYDDEVEVKRFKSGNLDGKVSSMETYFEGTLSSSMKMHLAVLSFKICRVIRSMEPR